MHSKPMSMAVQCTAVEISENLTLSFKVKIFLHKLLENLLKLRYDWETGR